MSAPQNMEGDIRKMELDYYLWKFKITRKAFAKLADITPPQVSELRQKKRNPSLPTAARIWRASNGKVSFLEQLMMKDRLIEDEEGENP